jgi:hypothetical protein
MTTSSNDQEALTAIRKANRVLEMARVTWEDLLKAINATQAAPPPRPQPDWQNVNTGPGQRPKRYDNAEEIDDMFYRLFNRDLREDFEEFAMSVHLWWKDKGFLTERQYNAIKRAVEHD